MIHGSRIPDTNGQFVWSAFCLLGIPILNKEAWTSIFSPEQCSKGPWLVGIDIGDENCLPSYIRIES